MGGYVSVIYVLIAGIWRALGRDPVPPPPPPAGRAYGAGTYGTGPYGP